ncbi:MAG: alanine racemase [Gammaproteobacteria bacterium]|nr:alanine racemase [Gammaproteobacteria bacterium]NNK99371.1 alanine racemase [Xanthomonadales bacterium]
MRPTCATVRLDAIAENYRLACRRAPGSQSMAVIKANAYGHGMVAVARRLESIAPAFAVALIDEAVELRQAGIQAPVLVMQGVKEPAEFELAAAENFWLMLHQSQQVETLLSLKLQTPVNVWIKLDTGMHRLGVAVVDMDDIYRRLDSSANVRGQPVLCTHLACADELDRPFTDQQVQIIRRFGNSLEVPLSIANSAGILHWPQSHAAWNRPGIMLYGSSPTATPGDSADGLQAAMTMQSEIIAVRDVAPGEGVGYGLDWTAERPSKIGTVAIGYGDGYPRHAPSGTPVLVNGQRVPLTGRVSMDAIGVDLTDTPGVEIGDPVELWGENLPVNEIAAAAGTISYEILAGLTGRVPLVHR